jgi:hypothetical protein
MLAFLEVKPTRKQRGHGQMGPRKPAGEMYCTSKPHVFWTHAESVKDCHTSGPTAAWSRGGVGP